MAQCESLGQCAFFQKYQKHQNATCKSLIHKYCEGEGMDECERRNYRLAHGKPPADNMLPTGQTFHAKSDDEYDVKHIEEAAKKPFWKFW